MSDYSNVIEGMFGTEPASNVAANIDVDPDKTALAMQLEKTTGVPATIISGNLEQFQTTNKAAMANTIVGANNHLTEYVRNNPLATSISNDDYGNLDSLSSKLKLVTQRANAIFWAPNAIFEKSFVAAGEGFAEGFGEGGPGAWLKEDDLKNRPLASAIVSGLAAPLEGILRIGSGAMRGITEATKAAGEAGYESLTGDKQSAIRFARDLAGMVEMRMQTGENITQPHPIIGQSLTAALKAREWLRSGEEPPVGLHPIIDQMKVERNATELQKIDDALGDALASTTRERSPEMFEGFVRQHVEDSSIGISGQRVVELYGDRMPMVDDGLLGWVPNITEQLRVAKETGADVNIPLASWLARVDPQVARELHDDMRVVRGGLTTREATELASRPPIPMIDEMIPQLRQSAGAEPLFSVGDRKLLLEPIQREVKPGYEAFHDFDILNENGQSVGTLNLAAQKGGKEIYIEMIEGIGEYMNPNNFGPALIRDLLRQIKSAFPEAEVITGHRVSGARGQAGTYNQPLAIPRIKLSELDPAEMAKFSELLGGAWTPIGRGVKAYLKPEWAEHEAALIGAVDAELARIIPKGIETLPASEIKRTDGRQMGGAYIRNAEDAAPFIAWAMNADDALGVARHEAIHHLRQAQFFDEGEWNILRKAAQDEGWIEKYGIDRRYRSLDEEGKFEEAIADAYKNWAEEYEIRQRKANFQQTVIDKIFLKLKEFFDAIRQKIKDILGHEPTFEELFQRVDSGEIGSREGGVGQAAQKFGYENVPDNLMGFSKNKPAKGFENERYRHIQNVEVRFPDGDVFQDAIKGLNKTHALERARRNWPDAEIKAIELEPKFSVIEEGKAQSPFKSAADVGMTVEQHRRYMKLIEERRQADLKHSVDKALKEQTKRQTKEWKEESEKIRPQVVADLNARPDIAADKFFGLGEMFGEKLDKTYRLDWESLTPEQRALLPERYTVRRGGVKADEVAPLFGYASGAEMITSMAKLIAEREITGLGRDRFMRRLIDDEINRRMEIEHGFLEKNILEDAKDQVLSENQLNLLHEETQALAMMSGEKGFDLTREELTQQMRENFDRLQVGVIDSEKFLREAGKYGKTAEMELLRGNPAEAFKAKQVQYANTQYAQMARALEKAKRQLDRVAKPYQRNRTSSIEPQFVDHIQKLLVDAGYKVKRNPEELAHSLEFHGSANLPEFVRGVADEGWDPIVSESIQAGNVKPLDTMTAAEFADFKDAIDSLNHIGREIRKIEIAGVKQDFADFKTRVIDNITQLPERSRKSQDRWLYKLDASLTRMEEMVKDLDLRQDAGPLWDAVIHPMVLSKSKEFDLMSELSTHFQETKGKFGRDWRRTLDDTIPNDVIFDPYAGAFYDMTRQNLLQVMLNWGNRSNIDKFVQGAAVARWGKKLGKEEAKVYEAQIKTLIDRHATAQDWQFVQRLWEPFKKWQGDMDTVARNTTGIAPPWIKPEKVVTPHGEFEGGYWPVKYDRLGSNIQVLKERQEAGTDRVFGTNYFRAATAKGYLKERTGYADFVDISSSIEQAVATMQQTIHDISFRDALMQAGKVFYDKDIRAAIRKHYGSEYEAQLIPWLKRISYQFSADDAAMKGFNDFLRRARINLVGHALPLNLKVILSPDVGVPNPVMWARFEANRSENVALAMTHSKEIKHLVYNLDRDYREALNRTMAKFGSADITKKALEWGYAPVAKVSQEFRMATFVDEFNKQRAKGKTEQEAALIADSRVREQHGAASIVDLPAALSSNEAMKMLTIFQGYFNTMYNWQRQLPGQIRRGEFSKAFVTAAGSVGVGAAYGATLFNQKKEDDSWFKIIGKALMLQPLSTIPVVSHAANYAFEGFAPRMPFASMLNAAGASYRDVVNAIEKKPLKKPISNTANVIGLSTGLPLAQVGRTSQFIYDVNTGKQRPRNIAEYMRGIISGEARLKK